MLVKNVFVVSKVYHTEDLGKLAERSQVMKKLQMDIQGDVKIAESYEI